MYQLARVTLAWLGVDAHHGWVNIRSPGSLALIASSLAAVACNEFESPPDIDTGTGDEEIEPDPEDIEVVYDGDGRGMILPARLRDVAEITRTATAREGLVVGAAAETWEDVVEAGQASLLMDDVSPLGCRSRVEFRGHDQRHA